MTITEIIFVCHAESEENEKYRSYYEGIQRLKGLQPPSTTQIIQSLRIFKPVSDSELSVLGYKQNLNTKIKLHQSKFWINDNLNIDQYLCAPLKASVETFRSLVPEAHVNKLLELGILSSLHTGDCNEIRSLFEDYLRRTPLHRIFVVASANYFTSLFQSSLLMRNCDVYKATVELDCVDSSKKAQYSAPRLLFRSDLSSYYPNNTLLSWQHILHGGGSDHSNNCNRSSKNAIYKCDDSSKHQVAVAYEGVSNNSGSSSGGDIHEKDTTGQGPRTVSAAIEDIDPICRICQVTYFEMPERPLIKPCRCSGSVKYVHVDCLNRWRATSPLAFTTCGMCQYTYRVRHSLLAAHLRNEDYTFLCALLLMVPLSFLAGTAVLRGDSLLECFTFGPSGDYLYFNLQSIVQSVLALRRDVAGELLTAQTASPLSVLLLGVNVLGVLGFFASSNPLSLLFQGLIFAWSLKNSVVAVFCVIVGWGTVMRELHLLLIAALRALNSWIGSIILEPS